MNDIKVIEIKETENTKECVLEKYGKTYLCYVSKTEDWDNKMFSVDFLEFVMKHYI